MARIKVLVSLDPGVVERIDSTREISRSAWIEAACRYQLDALPPAAFRPPTVAEQEQPDIPVVVDEVPDIHRHHRRRVGDRFVGGVNVGSWVCAECGEALG